MRRPRSRASAACRFSTWSTPFRMRSQPRGRRRVVSKRMLYVELGRRRRSPTSALRPYLDYRPLDGDEPDLEGILAPPGVRLDHARAGAESTGVRNCARRAGAPRRSSLVGRVSCIEKTEAAVKDRLTKEINYWDHRAEELKLQERAGKPNAEAQFWRSTQASGCTPGRLEKRIEELRLERQISPLPPVVLGGLLVVPIGLPAGDTGTPHVSLRRRTHRRPRPERGQSSWKSSAAWLSSRPTAN